MALSLSGDDEEYDSESEQVRAAKFHHVTTVNACGCLFVSSVPRERKRFRERNGVFFSPVASG